MHPNHAANLPEDFELFYSILGDMADSGTRSSSETDQAHRLINECKLREQTTPSGLPHPVHKGTIGEANDESLRRQILSFLAATLL